MVTIGDITQVITTATIMATTMVMYGTTLGIIPTSMVTIQVGIMALTMVLTLDIILIMQVSRGGVDQKRTSIIARQGLPLDVIVLS